MQSNSLKSLLISKGATLVGVGDVTQALTSELMHLNRAVAIAINRGLRRDTIQRLTNLQKETVLWLRERGYRYLSIPPDSDRTRDKFISRLYRLFSHKTAATCSGLGWVGKNGLVINSMYGSKLSWATVLTNAPLDTDTPIERSLCGSCNLCVVHCPSGALTGAEWSLSEPYKKIVIYERCRTLKGSRPLLDDRPNCGLCITICPYSRNGSKGLDTQRVDSCKIDE